MAVATNDKVIETITSLGGLDALVDNLGLSPKVITDLRDANARTLRELLAKFPEIANREGLSEKTVIELTRFLQRNHLNGGMTFKLVIDCPGRDPSEIAGAACL